MKVVTIIGARPQFIKAAPVSKELEAAGIDEFLLHTGQHYDPQMSDVFFDELKIKKPNQNLHIHNGSHGQQTGRMLEAIEALLLKEKPDRVLVYGDTNSTLAGALAAGKLHIPIDHLEAGLRSYNKKMPEEINRILTDHISSLLFTPTQTATNNLKKEGLDPKKILEVGDVMFDAMLHFMPLSHVKTKPLLEKLNLTEKPYYLATIHRAENTDSPENLRSIFKAFEALSHTHEIVFPLHPRTKQKLKELNLDDYLRKIHFIEPVGYLDMIVLMRHASFILTDSGGLQKEAYFSKVPCITLREQTEWTELIEAGWNKLVPVTKDLPDILKSTLSTFSSPSKKDSLLYGEGKASHKIAQAMLKYEKV